MISLTIDGRKVHVEEGITILDAAKSMGIEIPTLCYHPGLEPDGNCRLCMVQIEKNGKKRLVVSCMYPVEEGLIIKTDAPEVLRARSFVLQLLVDRGMQSERLRALADEYGVSPRKRFFRGEKECIRCGLCVRACEKEGAGAIGFAWRGVDRQVSPPFEEAPADCIGCLACVEVCPSGFIDWSDEGPVRKVWGKEFRKVQCVKCGEWFATKEQVAFCNLDAEEGGEYCPRCRKLLEAQAVGKAYGVRV